MTFTETELKGCYIIDFFNAHDNRGSFVKPFHADTLLKNGLNADFTESFYSVSHKGVIRGMHFQTPPSQHVKLVYCCVGKLVDVILDVRKNSPTYGKSISVELTGANFKGVYIPEGMAHGFETLEDNTLMTYLTTAVYDPNADAGIRYDSFGHQWESKQPIVSDRDLSFEAFDQYQSPF